MAKITSALIINALASARHTTPDIVKKLYSKEELSLITKFYARRFVDNGDPYYILKWADRITYLEAFVFADSESKKALLRSGYERYFTKRYAKNIHSGNMSEEAERIREFKQRA